jgi:hypothetical protein
MCPLFAVVYGISYLKGESRACKWFMLDVKTVDEAERMELRGNEKGLKWTNCRSHTP